MSKIKCIIIEDEPLAVKILTDYILQVPIPGITRNIQRCYSGNRLLTPKSYRSYFFGYPSAKIKRHGIFKDSYKSAAVIVTTAYHQYAVEGLI